MHQGRGSAEAIKQDEEAEQVLCKKRKRDQAKLLVENELAHLCYPQILIVKNSSSFAY